MGGSRLRGPRIRSVRTGIQFGGGCSRCRRWNGSGRDERALASAEQIIDATGIAVRTRLRNPTHMVSDGDCSRRHTRASQVQHSAREVRGVLEFDAGYVDRRASRDSKNDGRADRIPSIRTSPVCSRRRTTEPWGWGARTFRLGGRAEHVDPEERVDLDVVADRRQLDRASQSPPDCSFSGGSVGSTRDLFAAARDPADMQPTNVRAAAERVLHRAQVSGRERRSIVATAVPAW